MASDRERIRLSTSNGITYRPDRCERLPDGNLLINGERMILVFDGKNPILPDLENRGSGESAKPARSTFKGKSD